VEINKEGDNVKKKESMPSKITRAQKKKCRSRGMSEMGEACEGGRRLSIEAKAQKEKGDNTTLSIIVEN